MSIEQKLKKRFVEAITKSLPQCPLIGPKWFRFEPGEKRDRFRFVAMAKLVKATGLKAKMLAERLVKNLDVGDLGGEVRVADKYEIQVLIKKPGSGN